MNRIENPVIPRGSLVLVTGANGFIASNIIDLFLHEGYRVRGTVRDVDKHGWMIKHFESRYGKDAFALCHVPDMTKTGLWGAALKDVATIIHTATPTHTLLNVDETITSQIRTAQLLVEAAEESGTVKRLVYTSSSFAATFGGPNVSCTVGIRDYNQEALDLAWTLPKEDPSHGSALYAAANILVEQYLFGLAEKGLGIEINTVLPDSTFGAPISPELQGYTSTSGAVLEFFKSTNRQLMGKLADFMIPRYAVSVRDVARLHFIAAVHPGVQNERLWGCAEPWSWNRILQYLREKFPGRQFAEDIPGMGQSLTIFEGRERTGKVLEDSFGNGFESFETAIWDNVKAFAGCNAIDPGSVKTPYSMP